MSLITVSLFKHTIDVDTLGEGSQAFISVRLDGCTLHLPGYAQESATYARALAQALIDAADKMPTDAPVEPLKGEVVL